MFCIVETGNPFGIYAECCLFYCFSVFCFISKTSGSLKPFEFYRVCLKHNLVNVFLSFISGAPKALEGMKEPFQCGKVYVCMQDFCLLADLGTQFLIISNLQNVLLFET